MKQVVKLTYRKEAKLEPREIEAIVGELVGGIHGNDKIKELVDEVHGPTLFERVKNGVKGVAKSVAGVGLASDAVIDDRRSICETCQYRKGGACGKCGCSIFHKTRLASEQCPMSYWGQSTPKQ